MLRPILLAVGLACALGCSSPPPVVDAALEPRSTLSFAELAARATLPDGSDFRVEELGRDARSSHHLVQIRFGEIPHRHDAHDLLVVMLKGHGTLLLGDEVRAVGEGSLLYIPRGTRHAFTNASASPAVAYAIYLPGFDGKDRIDVP